jgi:acyl-CoA synthetase (AMP-forming)/AMP-acid ligase II
VLWPDSTATQALNADENQHDKRLALLPEDRLAKPTGANILSAFQGLDLTHTHRGIELDPLTPTQQRILELLKNQLPWPQHGDVAVTNCGKRGPNVFQGYHKTADTASFGAIEDGWLHTRRPRRAQRGRLSLDHGRKKDIIITAGGKNLAPANFENDLKQSPWISQAVMRGDRRPYPVVPITLDEEQIRTWAHERGLPTDIARLAWHPVVRELIQGELDTVNANYAQVEQAKKFVILDHDLSQQTGELTPTLKVVAARHRGFT